MVSRRLKPVPARLCAGHYTGAKAEARCLLIRAEASLSLSLRSRVAAAAAAIASAATDAAALVAHDIADGSAGGSGVVVREALFGTLPEATPPLLTST
jgi:hypothetical protein